MLPPQNVFEVLQQLVSTSLEAAGHQPPRTRPGRLRPSQGRTSVSAAPQDGVNKQLLLGSGPYLFALPVWNLIAVTAFIYLVKFSVLGSRLAFAWSHLPVLLRTGSRLSCIPKAHMLQQLGLNNSTLLIEMRRLCRSILRPGSHDSPGLGFLITYL